MSTDNPAAALARMKWDGMTKAERKAEIARLQAARNAKLTDDQKSEIARNAAKTRWAKKKSQRRKSNGDKG